MDDDQLETRKKLARFVAELKVQTARDSTVSIKLAQFVASALESYLEGKSKSLDAAFGLTPKRGAPGYSQLKKETARQILKMELEGKSKKQIADANTRYDERELRRIAKKHEVMTMSEELQQRLAKSDKKKMGG